MIRSMTGYGTSQQVDDGACFALEIRSLNNRYLKLSIKLPDHLQFLEHDIEKLLRGQLSRGSVTYSLRIRHVEAVGTRPLNRAAIERYLQQLADVHAPSDLPVTVDLASLTSLPGVCESADLDDEAREARKRLVCGLTETTLADLVQMRCREGESLHADVTGVCDQMRALVAEVGERAPAVVTEYHERLQTRVRQLMEGGRFELEADSLAREVAIYADRCDISEEVSRLGSHLDQFAELCQRGDRVGRTLDFLTQEMLREANTIGSKSNDSQIARSVVQVKGLIDRLKEQVQNVE